MHKCVKQNIIVHFIIQKLKNKHIFLKTEKAKSSHFDRTRGDKNQIFPTYFLFWCWIGRCWSNISHHQNQNNLILLGSLDSWKQIMKSARTVNDVVFPCIMAIQVMKFQVWGCKIRKIFAKKKVSKSANIWLSKSIFCLKNHRNLSIFFHWGILI